MWWKVWNVTRATLLSDRTQQASSFSARLVGLLGRRELRPGEGLLLSPCNAIHTLFMRFPIDALFLDKEKRVVKLFGALPPWRATSVYRHAHSVLELPAGVAAHTSTVEGDQLSFEL